MSMHYYPPTPRPRAGNSDGTKTKSLHRKNVDNFILINVNGQLETDKIKRTFQNLSVLVGCSVISIM